MTWSLKLGSLTQNQEIYSKCPNSGLSKFCLMLKVFFFSLACYVDLI